MAKRPTIGISACFFHADPTRPIFTGKTLQYVEQSIVHWVQSSGALALVIPSPEGPTRRGDVDAADYAELLDGLVLEGGSDMWPGSYGEEPLRPEWRGDRIRDEYEIALLRAFIEASKAGARHLPRPAGHQCRVRRHAVPGHRDTASGRDRPPQPEALRPELPHDRVRARHAPGGALSASGVQGARPTAAAPCRQQRASPGHQGPRAVLRRRGALPQRWRHRGHPLRRRLVDRCSRIVAAVQWHPEFHDWNNTSLLSGDPLLTDFLAATRAARRDTTSAC